MAKHLCALAFALAVVWLLWSGHTEPFLLGLGAGSCALVLVVCARMNILDDEGVPLGLRLHRLPGYLVWLVKQIVVANVDVALRIVKPEMPIAPRMVYVYPTQQSEMGRVILANSITLTPGTVSVDVQVDGICVHALSADQAEEDASGDMDRRVSDLERK